MTWRRTLALAVALAAAAALALGLGLGLARAAPIGPLPYAPDARDGVPMLSAPSFVAVDAGSGTVLLARGEHVRRPIASLTKMMTGLLSIETGPLWENVRVPKAATRVEPNLDGFKAGRWYSRELLLYSALLESNNDAAATLGYDLGGGSIERFYAKENARAIDLGMNETRYASASGLNDDTNLSTAYDQAILAIFALQNRAFARIVGTAERSFDWPPPTYRKDYANHNRMLGSYAGTYGVKTGFTSKAGGCLAVAVRRGGRSVVAIVLGSRNVWKDMPKLVDRAFARLGR
jgi:D-alanyl-D-alanine carboxypeptidase